MRNLLVGNGINIQFDTKNYSRQEIVLRLLKNCDRDDFPSHIIVDEPYLLKDYLGLLFLEAREIIKGKYDRYCVCSAERTSLEEFKNRYAPSLHTLRMTDIGFEDYYLIHDLACHKQKIYNPDQYTVREAMRMAYLFSIYNDGKLNELFRKYSQIILARLSQRKAAQKELDGFFHSPIARGSLGNTTSSKLSNGPFFPERESLTYSARSITSLSISFLACAEGRAA